MSLGHAAFMAIGAYGSAILARELGFSFWTALPASALLTGLIGLFFGLPSLRVKGFYLAMATLAAQFIIPWALRYPMEDLTGGTRPLKRAGADHRSLPFLICRRRNQRRRAITGICGGRSLFRRCDIGAAFRCQRRLPDIELVNPGGDVVPRGDVNMTVNEDEAGNVIGLSYIASKAGRVSRLHTSPTMTTLPVSQARVSRSKALSFATDIAMYYIIVPLSVLLMYLARNIIRTRTGRAFISVRDNDLAAELLGINVFTYKLRAFFLSAVYAGIAGCLLAFRAQQPGVRYVPAWTHRSRCWRC